MGKTSKIGAILSGTQLKCIESRLLNDLNSNYSLFRVTMLFQIISCKNNLWKHLYLPI